MAKWAMESYNV